MALGVLKDGPRLGVEQVERNDLGAERNQHLEQGPAAGERDAREVALQIIGKQRPTGGRMQHRIDVIEQIGRAEALPRLAALAARGGSIAVCSAFSYRMPPSPPCFGPSTQLSCTSPVDAATLAAKEGAMLGRVRVSLP